jgi:hypothetical protein
MRRLRTAFAPILASLALVLLAACGYPSPTAPALDLEGEYSLLVIKYDGGVPGTAPAVRGSLNLTSTEYEFVLEWWTGEETEGRVDRGTYSAANHAWRQSSHMQAGAAEGVYAYNGSLLVTDLVAEGHRVEASWRKVGPAS